MGIFKLLQPSRNKQIVKKEKKTIEGFVMLCEHRFVWFLSSKKTQSQTFLSEVEEKSYQCYQFILGPKKYT